MAAKRPSDERRDAIDSVEKVDVERSPSILRRLSFENALNLLVRKIARSQISASRNRKPTFSTVSIHCGPSRSSKGIRVGFDFYCHLTQLSIIGRVSCLCVAHDREDPWEP